MDLLEPVVHGPAPTPRCLVQYGKLLRLRGRRNEAVAVFQRMVRLYQDGQVSDSDDVAMAGVASWAALRRAAWASSRCWQVTLGSSEGVFRVALMRGQRSNAF
jgi:hypothetical protein